MSLYDFLYNVIKAILSTSWFVWFLVFEGSNYILHIGRSKNGYKKLKKTFSIPDRIFRWRCISLSKAAVKAQYVFVISLNLFYLSNLILAIFILIGCIRHAPLEQLIQYWRWFRIIKSVFIEIPTAIFVACNTYRRFGDSAGNFHWTFNTNTKKYKKKNKK